MVIGKFDLVLIRIRPDRYGKLPRDYGAQIGQSVGNHLALGTEVTCFGFPYGGTEPTTTRTKRERHGKLKFNQQDSPVFAASVDGGIDRGFSGGPCFERSTGQLIGIITNLDEVSLGGTSGGAYGIAVAAIRQELAATLFDMGAVPGLSADN